MPFVQKNNASDAAQTTNRTPDLETLLTQLVSTQASERRVAARLLGEHASSSEALCEQLWREKEASVREVIMTTLTTLGDEEAIDTLILCLRSEDASIRNEAIEAMKQLPAAMGPHIEDLLEDADADVRLFTVNVLSALAHHDTEKWLCKVLKEEDNVNVCGAALDVLTEIGTRASKDPIQTVCRKFPQNAYIQFAAKLALKRIGEG
jgi:HEAT repeat protein